MSIHITVNQKKQAMMQNWMRKPRKLECPEGVENLVKSMNFRMLHLPSNVFMSLNCVNAKRKNPVASEML